VLVLRREGGEPLSEPARGVDMDGDGDTRDTNDLFAAANGDAGYTPLVSVVNVTVPADTKSIDTTQDQTKADLQSASDLFSSGAPVEGKVIAVQRTGELRNMPLQKVAP
jgi:hypothetical protein